MTDENKVIERLTRLEERVKSIPNLLEAQISSLVSRLEDVAQVITLHSESMANEMRETKKKVNNLDTRVTVLEDRSDDARETRSLVTRYVIGFVAFLVVAVGVAAAYIQTLP